MKTFLDKILPILLTGITVIVNFLFTNYFHDTFSIFIVLLGAFFFLGFYLVSQIIFKYKENYVNWWIYLICTILFFSTSYTFLYAEKHLITLPNKEIILSGNTFLPEVTEYCDSIKASGIEFSEIDLLRRVRMNPDKVWADRAGVIKTISIMLVLSCIVWAFFLSASTVLLKRQIQNNSTNSKGKASRAIPTTKKRT